MTEILVVILWTVGWYLFVGIIIGPSVWVITSLVAVGIAELRRTLRPSGKPGLGATDVDLSAARLASDEPSFRLGVLLGILLPATMFFMGLVLHREAGLLFSEVMLSVQTLTCCVWWLWLRRRSVANAAVYAFVVWLMTRSAWSIVMVMDPSGPDTIGTRWYGLGGGYLGSDYGIDNLFGGVPLLLIGAVWGVTVACAALVLARVGDSRFNPRGVLLLSFPYLGLFWFTQPAGYVHLAVSMALVGYAVSAEFRRKQDDGRGSVAVRDVIGSRVLLVFRNKPSIASLKSPSSMVARQTIVLILVTVAGIWAAAVIWGHGSYDWDAGEFVFVQVSVIGIAALALLWILFFLGGLMRYGAMLLGWVWMLIMVLTYDATNLAQCNPPWDVTQYLATTAAAGAMLWVMWRVFGPGAVESRLTSGLSP